jgi:urease accessory protein
MKIFSEIIGNMLNDDLLAERIADYDVERLPLDQWTAQKSRFIAVSDKGREYAVALSRNVHPANGDLLWVDHVNRRALVVAVELNQVFVIDLAALESLDKQQVMQICIELGHAIGNQHWPAVVKGTKVYVPLTVDRKVMQSVMDTHAIPGITYRFEEGDAVIPYLLPGEIRNIFSGAPHESANMHTHGCCTPKV